MMHDTWISRISRNHKRIPPLFSLLAGYAFYAALLGSLPAHAQSAQERANRIDQEIALSKSVKKAEKACGKTFDVAFDWKASHSKNWKGYSIASNCSVVTDALATFCKGKNARAYIRKHISKVRCTVVPQKKGSRMQVKRGTIRYDLDVSASNAASFVRVELMKRL